MSMTMWQPVTISAQFHMIEHIELQYHNEQCSDEMVSECQHSMTPGSLLCPFVHPCPVCVQAQGAAPPLPLNRQVLLPVSRGQGTLHGCIFGGYTHGVVHATGDDTPHVTML
ncbi:hypothetical protein HaLaN_04728 [Haematococcus lacustris]|uniref:Uncharacterized protein n=1 Tax=Haematococcus lacustris TaxID=44745 RepID=A0A699YP55_HAELA|nr:hypothetical protein HaLaN_04728 [Haematococcus lacustris]